MKGKGIRTILPFQRYTALFATAQFSRYQEVEAFVQENFQDSARVSRAVQGRGDRS
ncbi:MAG: hypothetical protein M0P22_00280 [Methanoculleus sp.]|nr:hypothetical protein [Methanoculleus sp.]